MASCSIEEKERLLTRYTNIFKSSGLSLEESKKLANERFNQVGNINRLGSSNSRIDTTNARVETLTADNLLQVFDSLANNTSLHSDIDSTQHKEFLRTTLEDSLNAFRRIGEHTLSMVANQGVTRGEIVDKNIAINVESNIIATPIPMSPAEVMVHEVEHAITKEALRDPKNHLLVKELFKLWKATKEHLTSVYGKGNEHLVFVHRNSDGSPYYPLDKDTEEQAARDRYDYIFGSSSVGTEETTDKYGQTTTRTVNVNLHEFLAYGRSNANLSKAMEGFKFRQEKIDTTSFDGFLKSVYLKVLDWFVGAMTNTNNKNAKVALRNLVRQLTKIQVESKINSDNLMSKVDQLEDTVVNLLDYSIFKPWAEWSWKKERDSGFKGGAIVKIGGLINPRSFDKFKYLLKDVKRSTLVGHRTLVGEAIKEATTGEERSVEKITYRSKALLDAQVELMLENVTEKVKTSFLTKNVSTEESEALTISLIETDIVSLGLPIDDIPEILLNNQYRDMEIAKLIKTLNVPNDIKNHYINQARSLGHHMATGVFLLHDSMKNAHNIARGFGDRFLDITDEMANAHINTIDKLASLYAIQYTTMDAKRLAVKLIQKEQKANKDDNGISTILNLHRMVKEESLRDNFEGNPTQTTKGFIEAIYNPNISLKVGTKKDEKELLANGYKKIKTLERAKTDVEGPETFIFINRHDGINSRVKTVFSLTREHHVGTDVITRGKEDLSLESYLEGYDNVSSIRAKNRAYKEAATKINYHIDEGIIPEAILDENGSIVNYSYSMSHANKRILLEQKRDVSKVLATMFSRTLNKKMSKEINAEALKLLVDDYKENYSKNPRDYVTISAESEDKELKEIYRLLPPDVKMALVDSFGTKEITIRNEWVRPFFGYRDKTISDIKYLNRMSTKIAETILKEIIAVAKTSIVVRTFRVLRDNIISNTLYLLVAGVPLEKVFKYQLEGVRAIHTFLADRKRVAMLKLELADITLENYRISEIKAEIATLEESITNNPIYPLIQENLFQTITEDVAIAKDDYSYINRFAEWVQPKKKNTAWNIAETLAKESFMAKDTQSFNIFFKATQYGDFVARYALYKHGMGKISKDPNITTNAQKETAREELLTQLTDMFINYETITSPWIKYANDIGLSIFTRYPLRITRSLFYLTRKRPVSMLKLLTLQSIFGIDIPDPTDSTILGMGLFNNPVTVAGAAFNLHGLDAISSILD